MDTRERVRELILDLLDTTDEFSDKEEIDSWADAILVTFADERSALQERIDDLVAREAKLVEAIQRMNDAEFIRTGYPNNIARAALDTVKEGK